MKSKFNLLFILGIILCVVGFGIGAADIDRELGANIFIFGWLLAAGYMIINMLFSNKDSPMVLPMKVFAIGFLSLIAGSIPEFFDLEPLNFLFVIGQFLCISSVVWGIFRMKREL